MLAHASSFWAHTVRVVCVGGCSILLLHFRWDKWWDTQPRGAGFTREWPGLSQDAAAYVVEKGVKLVGCDTMAIDVYGSEDNPAHHTLLGHGVLIVENLHNLAVLPPFSIFLALPLPFKDGSGSPVRAIALMPVPPDGLVRS